MSGGIAYVLDEDGSFPGRVNMETVDLDPLEPRTWSWCSAWCAGTSSTRAARRRTTCCASGTRCAQVREGLPQGLQAGARRSGSRRRAAMGDARGFLKQRARVDALPEGGRAPRTGATSRTTSRRRSPGSRRRAAWTAGSRSATTDARWATSSPTSTIWSIRDKWEDALARLHSTNNFPEFTGLVCPSALRAGLRPGHQPGPGDHQAGRVGDRPPRLGGGLDQARSGPSGAAAAPWPWWARGRPACRPPSSSPAPATR